MSDPKLSKAEWDTLEGWLVALSQTGTLEAEQFCLGKVRDAVARIAWMRSFNAAHASANLVEAIKVHVDDDPHSTCPDGCGWFNYAAQKLHQSALIVADDVANDDSDAA